MMPPPWPDTATIDASGDLRLAGIPLGAVAEECGTPVYVFDAATFARRAASYRDGLAAHYPGEAEVHYACKAFLNVAVAQLVSRHGLHLDAVSTGEAQVGLHAGVPGRRIHLHGNAKTDDELRLARRLGVGTIIADNLPGLRGIAAVAREGGELRVMLRLAPDVAANTHPHIATGAAASKFGIPLERLLDAARIIASEPKLRYEGLHCHIGSQITDLLPYRAAVRVLLAAAGTLRRRYGWTTRRDVHVPELRNGDVLAVPAAGAYTLSMASAYNHVPRPPVVLVQDGHSHLITRRETHRDLMARDNCLPDPPIAGPSGPDPAIATTQNPHRHTGVHACCSIET
ncbi:hypothetical protein ABGB14_41015 [Nonomuraea sp. B10E15]|uniref:diaminopimelate decarboxylase family protein n=1 Tax=Nonomuraea sp. B10E15 TaxID=3153560 RepID=UPI00325DD39F